jgi:hypothetical protein
LEKIECLASFPFFLLKNQEFERAERYADWKFVYSPPGLGKAIEKSAAK